MVTIEFKTDNAAFEGDNFPYECSRILNDLAEKLLYDRTGEIPLRDTNGNRVGTAHVSQDEDDG